MVTVFLPTRSGSERVKNKNTRDFAGIKGGLLNLKLNQLMSCRNVSEIVLSTNDELCMEIAYSFNDVKLKVVERPEHLSLSSTSLIDLVRYVPDICSNSDILWTHVTSPFVKAEDYDNIISKYYHELRNGFDSLMTVHSFRNFLWDKDVNDIINRVGIEKWPRTQDLKVFHEIDSAVFLTSKAMYRKNIDRIGISPYLYELDKIKGLDIDWPEDFRLAEIVFSNFYNRQY
jgi:N-acylneuraminate cytidylyltransferase